MIQNWYISVFYKEGFNDPVARSVESNLKEFNIDAYVKSVQNYEIQSELSKRDVTTVCEELLCDKIVQKYYVRKDYFKFPDLNDAWLVKVGYKPGVMDATGLSVNHAINVLGFRVNNVRTAASYLIKANVNYEEIYNVVKQFFANELINDVNITKVKQSYYEIVKFSSLSADELVSFSKELMLALNKNEMLEIQRYFKELGREPTDAELETLAQTWSEHCVHKTFKGLITYKGERINSLLDSFIMRATNEIYADWCINVFSDNAGIISFNDLYGLAVKVETHNHPTALDPYGGAGTGSGGVFRDVLGVGAKPILSTDCLFFGSLSTAPQNLPRGVMHPKRLMKGSIAGIRDYGNKMGIPTANGCVGFHEDYLGNPLVFAGVVGLIPKEKYVRKPKPGDSIVLVGGRTGRDGIHGVTFASLTLSSDSETIASSAVQIGNPLEERRVLDGLLRVRDYGDIPLYSAITDCGGGGLSSAIGEMGKDLGAVVNLQEVPLKYEGLQPWEIWISESQERMILAVPPENVTKLIEIFATENCEATVIGEFTNTKRLELKYNAEFICNLDMDFLHNGIPKVSRTAFEKKYEEKFANIKELDDYNEDLKKILAHPIVASKEWVIRQYDHEVQANTIIKPLQGATSDGHGDACVIKPLPDSWRGFIVSNGFNPNFSNNPRKMALNSIDEAIRNNICSGGRRFALLDNFSWGSPEDAENLGALVEACKACYESATFLKAPFISGKDSLYNDFTTDNGKRITIPHTLLITCIGLIPDVRKSITSDFKKEGNSIYLIGVTKRELGGSLFYKVNGVDEGIIPDVDLSNSKNVFEKLIKAIDAELILACHDCSEGGLVVTIAEMCFGGSIGAEIQLSEIKTEINKDYEILFSESNTRFIVEVDDSANFEKMMEGVNVSKIGIVKGDRLTINGLKGNPIIDETINDLKDVWRKTFDW